MPFLKLIMALCVPQSVITYATAQGSTAADGTYWQNDGNLCEMPIGPYTTNCSSKLDIYKPHTSRQKPICEMTAICQDNNGESFKTNYLFNQGVVLKLEFDSDWTLHPLENNDPETSPLCLAPKGNYLNSCTAGAVSYVDDQQICVFSTFCDKYMRYNPRANPSDNDYVLNQMEIPPYEQPTHVKNLKGRLIHPSGHYSLTDECYPFDESSALKSDTSDATTTALSATVVAGVGVALALS